MAMSLSLCPFLSIAAIESMQLGVSWDRLDSLLIPDSGKHVAAGHGRFAHGWAIAVRGAMGAYQAGRFIVAGLDKAAAVLFL